MRRSRTSAGVGRQFDRRVGRDLPAHHSLARDARGRHRHDESDPAQKSPPAPRRCYSSCGFGIRQEISKVKVIMILLYIVLLYRIQKNRPVEEMVKEAILERKKNSSTRVTQRRRTLERSRSGSILIFIAGNLSRRRIGLLRQVPFHPRLFRRTPAPFLGTNIPELVIAIRCIFGRHKDIAFGDYMEFGCGDY